MTSCHDMKKGDIFYCQDCGLELKVVKECEDTEPSAGECGCCSSESDCTFMCCGEELMKK
jgi:hypothetical protein